MLKPIFENIPDEIKSLPQFVNWKREKREGKLTKTPRKPSGDYAKSNDPLTWSTFEVCKNSAKEFDGIGFVLSKNDPYIGLDFDHCRCPAFDDYDPEISGGLNMVLPNVADHIRKLNSYTEVSPSGKGIRILLKGKLSVDGKKKGDFEAYQALHYLTMTGHVLDGFPLTIEPRQKEVDAFFQDVFGGTEKSLEWEKKARTDTSTGDWKERLERAFKSKNGAEIHRLYSGDHSAHPSQSEADLSLCSHFAFWFDGDAIAIDAAFRESGLFRDKWDATHHGDGTTYGEFTIKKAIAGCTSFHGDHQSQENKKANLPSLSQPEVWPALSDDAFPGWIGDFVKMACEHSEADPAAVLVTLLGRFAAEVGSGPYVNIGDARHRARTNFALAGSSSKSRKGTSKQPVNRVFNEIPSAARCTPGPLSSGEGLIYAVRDEVIEFDKKKQEYVTVDPGVTDKRLFVLDEEFAAALNCTKREGNTLSAIIRGFFDDGNAEPLTKSFRIKATGAHVVIVTHITEMELISLLNQVQMSNGFGNRFLWILSRRQKLMALPSPMPDSEVDQIRKIVIERIESARDLKAVGMSDDAKKLWIESYPGLTMDFEGVTGSVVNRIEAHAIRLALIYALCAGHSQIEVDNLKAALALVEYSRRSAFRIFGSAVGDKKKIKIIDALRSADNHEMTISEISNNVFKRNMNSDELHKLLSEMESSKLIVLKKSPTGGAPKTIVKFQKSYEINEINEKSPSSTPLNSLNSLIRTSETEILTFTEDDFSNLELPL